MWDQIEEILNRDTVHEFFRMADVVISTAPPDAIDTLYTGRHEAERLINMWLDYETPMPGKLRSAASFMLVMWSIRVAADNHDILILLEDENIKDFVQTILELGYMAGLEDDHDR